MKTLVTYKVLFDTTTLCAAIQSPNGLNMQLLQLARIRLIEPVITEEVIAEWVRNCRKGFGGVVYDDTDIELFCEVIEPLLSPQHIVSVQRGRTMAPLFPIARAGKATIIQSPVGQPRTFAVDATTLALKDIFDNHVVTAAIEEGCHYLCSGNTRDLPDGHRVQDVEFITPRRLHTILSITP